MKRVFKTWGLVVILLLSVGVVHGHPLAPALLQMEQTGPATWQVLWRHSRLQNSRTPPRPVFAPHCTQASQIERAAEPGAAVTARWVLRCGPGLLAGTTLAIERLQESPINVIVRLRDESGAEFQTLLDAERSQFVVPNLGQSSGVALRYLKLGVEHLVFGPDHLLFLLALMLLVVGARALTLTITAFTLGHSVTLSLAALGFIQVNAAVMELGIALSLVVVARELLGKRRSWLGRNPASMALIFGLLHGLGFAGALASVGLPRQEVVSALLAFNLGIELGQLLVIAMAGFLFFGLRYVLRRVHISNTAVTAAAYLIGTVAVFWCLERSLAVLGWTPSLVN